MTSSIIAELRKNADVQKIESYLKESNPNYEQASIAEKFNILTKSLLKADHKNFSLPNLTRKCECNQN